ncbi:MAG: histidine phosphatase family protein [Gammaproteobacteria bacterium]|jgi:broad specificity phosphatase PhoE
MKLYCLRHGETEYNRLGLCNDDPGRDVHLTETGIRQAEAVAAELRDLPLECVFVSELPRTRQTADIINRYHGVPVTAHPALNDIRSGFDGRSVADYFAATGHDRLHARANGGESLLDYQARVLGFIDWLRAQPENVVLVVAHEETLRVFRAYFDGLADEAMPGLAFGNCVVCCFELE